MPTWIVYVLLSNQQRGLISSISFTTLLGSRNYSNSVRIGLVGHLIVVGPIKKSFLQS